MSSVGELYTYFKNLYNVYKNAVTKYGYDLEKVMNELSTYVTHYIETHIASIPEIQNFTDYDKEEKSLIKYIILVRFMEASYFSEYEMDEDARKQLEEMIKYLESIGDDQ